MPVSNTHPQYDARIEQWQMLRDAAAGEDAVKAAGTRYLPQLGGQDRDAYQAYKMRASYHNATGRTIDGLSGMVFRKPPQTDVPDGMDTFMDDVTLGGVPFQGFAENVVGEVLEVGRAGVLVDFPSVEAGNVTQAEAEQMNLRPFLSLYQAESILNWRVGQVGNRTVLTQLRLSETVSEPQDEFTDAEVEQIRVLDLIDGVYRQRVFRKSDDEWVEHDQVTPTMRGETLSFIPFVFLGPQGTTPSVDKPPLLDLAFVNLSHYRTVADLEHGAHFTALPTPYAFGSGMSEAGTIHVGPESFLTGEESQVSIGMLEFSGAGLSALETRRESKEQQMAALGARMLAPEKRQAEAAETAMIHRQGEISVLASLSHAVSLGLTRAVRIARDWMGLSGEVEVQLNTDFMPQPMDAQQLTALMKLWQAGGISFGTLHQNLKSGEVVPPDQAPEDEQAEIETSAADLNNLRG